MDDGQAAAPDRAAPGAIAAAVEALWSAKRPLVITGRGARGAAAGLVRLLDATARLYLDTQESRGLVPAEHPAFVGAMRAAAMNEADVVLLIGRKLDYQIGYGSPAVFPHARFIRFADNAGELIDNRRGAAGIAGDARARPRAMVEAAGNREPALDKGWADGLRASSANAGEARRPIRVRRPARTARSIRARSSMPSPQSPIPITSRSPTAATS